MNVSLTRELESFVDQKVQSGRYGSASEVIREALRLMEERDREQAHRVTMLRRDLAKGVAQLDRGAGIPGDVVLRELEEKARTNRRRRKR